jgi:hypothetical protein
MKMTLKEQERASTLGEVSWKELNLIWRAYFDAGGSRHS